MLLNRCSWEASARQFPIIATLSSRKIYVGLVTCPALENGLSEHLEILPLLSGYRDKDDLTINITTNYHQHYLDSGVISGMSRLNIQDFRVLLPKDEVETISFLILKRITNLKKTKRVTGKTAASWVVKSHPHAGERLLATQSRVVHDYAA